MLRTLFRQSRTIRVPIDDRNVGVRAVKFRRPMLSGVSRFVILGAITTLTIQGMRYLDPLGNYEDRDIVQEQLDDARTENSSIVRDAHQDHQHARTDVGSAQSKSQSLPYLRLTVPVWIRRDASRPYEHYEPEFQEYARLQADEKRMEKIRRQIFDTVLQSIKQSPQSHVELRVIGFNGKITGALEFVPQLFAPPLYEVPCVWIDLNRINVRFDWRLLEQDTGARIERVFRPLVAFDAATNAAKVFLNTTYIITRGKVRELLGLSKVDLLEEAKAKARTPLLPKRGTEDSGSLSDSQELTKSPKLVFPVFPDWSDGKGTRKLHSDIVGAMPYSLAIQQAATAFNRVKTARQRAALATNTRGICQIRGYITFMGSRGKFKMEVVANYLPSENVFIGGVQVKQRYIVQDFVAMKALQEARIRKEAEEAAKKEKNLKVQIEEDVHKTMGDSSSVSPSSARDEKGKD